VVAVINRQRKPQVSGRFPREFNQRPGFSTWVIYTNSGRGVMWVRDAP